VSDLIHRLQIFRGLKVIDCIDRITQVGIGYSINVMDPSINIGPIDNDNHRLNVKTDSNGVIVKFTIG
jgi:hypothetical protein